MTKSKGKEKNTIQKSQKFVLNKENKKVTFALLGTVFIIAILIAVKPADTFLNNYVGQARAIVLSITSAAFSDNTLQTALANSLLVTAAISTTNATITSFKTTKLKAGSSSFTIFVNSNPYTTIGDCGTNTNCVLDSGEYLNLTVQPYGGTFPQNCGIVNLTAGFRQGGVRTFATPGDVSIFSFKAGNSGSFAYESICTDSSSNPATSTSSPIYIKVNPAPYSTIGSCGNPCVVNSGQIVSIRLTPVGGTYPQFCGLYNVTGGYQQGASTTASSSSSPGIVTFTARTGLSQRTFSYQSVCTDSASFPLTTRSGNLELIVNPSSGSFSTVASTSTTVGTSTSTAYPLTPPDPVHQSRLSVENLQSQGIPNNFQLMVQLNASTYAQYEAGSMQNVFFSYSNGTVIPSWLEGNAANENQQSGLNHSVELIYWLKIASASFLPAHTNQTIYINFAPKKDSLFNTADIGEAPQLSGIYGEYDDGKNIFLDYQSFGSLGSAPWPWNIYGGSVSYNRDYMTLSAWSGSWGGIWKNAPASLQSGQSIMDVYGDGQVNYGVVSNLNYPTGSAYKMIEQGYNCGGGTDICLNVGGSETHVPLLASIYTLNSTPLQSEYSSYYSNPNQGSLFINDVWDLSAYSNFPQPFSKALIGDNYSILSRELMFGRNFSFNSKDYIMYDLEEWDKTPMWEQDGVAYWVSQWCATVHADGYRCAFSPEVDFGGTIITDQLRQVNWNEVDLLQIETQPFTNTGGELSTIVNSVLANSITINPNMQVYAMVDTNGGLGMFESQVKNLSKIPQVHGITVTYITANGHCPICTPSLLQSAVNYVKSQTVNYATNSNQPEIYSLHDVSFGNTTMYYNYNFAQLVSGGANTARNYVGFFSFSGQSENIYWYRTRALPPSDVMPSVVSFGS